MQAVNFEYDNQLLSDYGFTICDFNFSSGANEISAGSVITFNKTPRNQGKSFSLTSTQYNECITSTFDICKDPDQYDLEDMEISSDEYASIMRWLNRREFLRFSIVSEEENGPDVCYYKASFNVSKITIRDKLYGIRLVMETDSPFGYGMEENITLSFSGSKDTKKIYDKSNEVGSISPTVVITCKASGDLSLVNESENCVTVIKNCSLGETITLYGDTQIITTSNAAHDVCNDFNYEFFRIGNTFISKENTISASIPCDVNIRYSPIIKDAL